MEPKLKAVIEVMFELLEMSKIEQAKMRDESKRGFCEMPSDTPHDCPNGQTFNGRIKMTATTSWRDHIKIHPATELLPRMDKRQLAKLAEDIRRNGLLEPITTMCVNDKEMIVDGVNRLDAMASLGWNFLTPKGELCKTIKIKGNKNIHRRHLTSAQKRELVAKLLKLDASKSNRQIAKL